MRSHSLASDPLSHPRGVSLSKSLLGVGSSPMKWWLPSHIWLTESEVCLVHYSVTLLCLDLQSPPEVVVSDIVTRKVTVA